MERSRNSLLAIRVVCVAVTFGALFFVLHRVNAAAMLQALHTMHPIWFVAALVVYGLLFLPAAWRWHLALRLAGNDVAFAITLKTALMGHFFYTILFGALGGDTARSALYARRQNLPMAEILAASSLDRLMGLIALIGFIMASFGIAVARGGLDQFRRFTFVSPSGWLIAAIILVIMFVLVVVRRSSRHSALRRFSTALSQSGRRLAVSPDKLLPGVGCGFLVQLSLSVVLALNLQAVSHEPVPWLQLFWTFPLISVASSVPITVAGMGTRDSAALALLGLYGIAGPDAVAASLLTAGVGLFWAAVGGLLLWRETGRGGKPNEGEIERMENAGSKASA